MREISLSSNVTNWWHFVNEHWFETDKWERNQLTQNSHHPLAKPKCQDSLLRRTFPSVFITQSDKLNHLFCRRRRRRRRALTSLCLPVNVCGDLFRTPIFFSVRVVNNELVLDVICIFRLISILFVNRYTFPNVQLECHRNRWKVWYGKKREIVCNHLSNNQQFYSLQIIWNKITPLFQLNIEHCPWINNSN